MTWYSCRRALPKVSALSYGLECISICPGGRIVYVSAQRPNSPRCACPCPLFHMVETWCSCNIYRFRGYKFHLVAMTIPCMLLALHPNSERHLEDILACAAATMMIGGCLPICAECWLAIASNGGCSDNTHCDCWLLDGLVSHRLKSLRRRQKSQIQSSISACGCAALLRPAAKSRSRLRHALRPTEAPVNTTDCSFTSNHVLRCAPSLSHQLICRG